MKILNDYLIELKEKCGSDYRAAKMLGVSKVTVCNLKKRQQLSDDLALKIADILNVEPEEILIAAAMARSEGRVKQAWENISKNVSRASVLLVSIGVASPALEQLMPAIQDSGMYIMLNYIISYEFLYPIPRS